MAAILSRPQCVKFTFPRNTKLQTTFCCRAISSWVITATFYKLQHSHICNLRAEVFALQTVARVVSSSTPLSGRWIIEPHTRRTPRPPATAAAHYSDVMMKRWRLKSPTSRLFIHPFVQAQIKENIKVPRHWPLWGEFTGGRRILRTKGQ